MSKPIFVRPLKGGKEGVRIVSCYLPKKSPWLNPIEPKWMHGKRRVVETTGPLNAHELAERVCSAFDCPHHEHLCPFPKRPPDHALGSV